MTPKRCNHLANQLRADLTRAHWPEHTLPDTALQRIVQHIGLDRHDIAYAALQQYPRPLWLVQIAGAYPYNLDADALDPRSIASIDDWGHAG